MNEKKKRNQYKFDKENMTIFTYKLQRAKKK